MVTIAKVTNSLAIEEEDPYLPSTVDNPYNPHKDYDKWERWSEDHGYKITTTIARLAIEYIDDIDNEDQVNLAADLAFNQMLETDYLGIYCKVYEGDKTPLLAQE